MTKTYPNTAAGYAQAVAEHGEANLLVDPFARTITVKPDDTAPTEVDAQTYVNQMPDDQLDWLLDMAFGQSPDSDTRRTLFRKFFSSPSVQINLNDAPVAAVQSKIEQAVKGGGILSQQHLKTVTTLFG